jgi:hypothetical protein
MRIFQASGLAFLFIPINTIAYIGVKQTENNDVSGLTNLARNIGGSCGTAFHGDDADTADGRRMRAGAIHGPTPPATFS